MQIRIAYSISLLQSRLRAILVKDTAYSSQLRGCADGTSTTARVTSLSHIEVSSCKNILSPNHADNKQKEFRVNSLTESCANGFPIPTPSGDTKNEVSKKAGRQPKSRSLSHNENMMRNRFQVLDDPPTGTEATLYRSG